MKKDNKTPAQAKPFLTGAPTDENTVRQALKFFAILLITVFMTFIICSMTSFKSVVLRILVNLVIESLVILMFYSKGADFGMDGVSRGEILYNHQERGIQIADSERKIPFNKAKGFIIGLLGASLFLIASLILAFTAKKQMITSGTLPSWMDAFSRREEIFGALVHYTQGGSMMFTDYLRVFVRLMLMPFISMAGAENRDMLLFIERISPVLVLIPALSYGIGYLQGPARRKNIHTEIARNNKRRISRERKARKARAARSAHGPEQLN